MKPDEIRNVAVIGAGLMGHGIALEFALGGLDVRLHDISREKLDEGMLNIRKDFSMLVAAHLVTQQQADVGLQNIHPSIILEEVAVNVDVVVEAVFENLEIKRSIFSRLDAICQPGAIFSSNTSTLLPSSIASATRRPDKVLVTHYFNPPFLLPLVEVVRGAQTSDETITVIVEFLKKLGKSPALVQKEVPGFIGNRLQMAMLREALSLIERGIASPQDIDVVIKNSFGRRLSTAGVFEIFEIAGWDLIRQVALNLLPSIASSTELSPILQDKVERGELGVKTGKGFYQWTPESSEALRHRISTALINIQKFTRNKGGNEA